MNIREVSAMRIVVLAVLSEEDQITIALADLVATMAIDTVLISLPARLQVSVTDMQVIHDIATHRHCKHVNIWTTTDKNPDNRDPKTLPYHLDKADIKNDLTGQRPIYPLSCYGPGRDVPRQLIEGPVEISPEELRVRYYTQRLAGAEAVAVGIILPSGRTY
jgi:hypothetical protein